MRQVIQTHKTMSLVHRIIFCLKVQVAYGEDKLPPDAVQIVGRVVAWKVED